MKHHVVRLLAGILLVLAVSAPSASGAPVTTNLRIEGATSTLFEGPITTDVRPFHYTGDATMHECDGTSSTGGTSPTPVVTRGTVVAAAIDAGLQANGTWFSFGPGFDTIAGQNVAFDPATNDYLVEYDHGTVAETGACSDPVSTGEEVLFAYGDGNQMALSLTAPASVAVGQAARVVVRNAADKAGQAGATVGGATTGADGVAMVSFPRAGTYTLKAQKPGAIRSNAVTICVHSGDDDTCRRPASPGGPASTGRPVVKIAGLHSGQRFRKQHGPHELRGSVTGGDSVKSVEVRLRRKAGKHCFAFNAKRERFTRMRCSRGPAWFSVGAQADWSYLLPARLRAGQYQLQVRATDAAGNQSSVQSLRFRVA
jgi:hypothetical protein